MQTVSFPNFNINLQISKVAFKILGVPIYWYGIIIVQAIVVCIYLCSKDKQKYGITNKQIYELLTYVLPVSIISARIYYVLFKLDYFIKSPMMILNIRDGGLAIYGGLIGGSIVVILYCKSKKIKILDLLDVISPYVVLRTKYW